MNVVTTYLEVGPGAILGATKYTIRAALWKSNATWEDMDDAWDHMYSGNYRRFHVFMVSDHDPLGEAKRRFRALFSRDEPGELVEFN